MRGMKWLNFLDHDYGTADTDTRRESYHIFLCASTDVWEDLDLVVFPMLFLVKRSWLSL